MKRKDILATVILLAESSDYKAVDNMIRDIFKQTWKNLELIVTYSKGTDYVALKDKWMIYPANIFWVECSNLAELFNKPYEICNGDYIFYKSVNPILWYQRHIEHHLDLFEEARFKDKWSYSLVELKEITLQEPMNNLGWRLDFPRQEQLLLDEVCHSKDIKPNWTSCVIQQNNVVQFIPGAILKELKNYHLVNPSEITITFFINSAAQQQQPQQAPKLGTPASNDIKETILEVDGDLVISKSYPTIVGSAEFSDRNKNILKQVNPDEIRNIAVKRSMGMGDVLLTEPIIRALKKKYNKTKVKLYTTNYSSADQLVKLFPELDGYEIIGQEHLVNDYLANIEGFNLKFDLDLAYESRPGFRYIDGYLEVCGFEETLQEINGELSITRGISEEDIIPRLNYEKERLIKEDYFSVELAGSSWQSKEWSLDGWKKIIDYIAEKLHLVSVYLSAQKVITAGHINSNNDFDNLINFIKYAKFHIGSDSGPMQLSTAFNKLVFIVSGAALAKYTTPSKKVFSVTKEDLQCLGCKHRMYYEQNGPNLTFVPRCTNKEFEYQCMKDLSADYVLSKFEEFVKINNL